MACSEILAVKGVSRRRVAAAFAEPQPRSPLRLLKAWAVLLAPWELDPALLCKLCCAAVSVIAFPRRRDFVAAYAVFPRLRVDISDILLQAPIAQAVTHGPSLS
ncbi:hypothetical protein AK812_SmicGene22863 [Symbiodinium microadriaticum]|uniref:Uncharacterized protein n=1 Tax=Symbiodinium microadriaticum TaxID=2951 RepID=A0A1Q9DIP8_SYMMI|nr:hypothetical protein AK812_SmicGene22863 [Symbiodinium microadriaticum]